MTVPEGLVYHIQDDAAVSTEVAALFATVGLHSRAFGDAKEFLLAPRDKDQPGCLLLDVRLPGMSGLALQSRLKADGDQLPLIFYTAYGDVETARQAFRNGAFDFLAKPCSGQTVLDSVQGALASHARQIALHNEQQALLGRFAVLLPREREVLNGIVQGRSNKAIALSLGLSVRTVELYRATLFRKLQADSLAALILMCHRAGFAPPPPPQAR